MDIFQKGISRYFTTEQLDKISSKRIGIAGGGGLGSNVAVILARCGFSTFEILDYDNIEPSNLNRQNYFIDEIGKCKVEMLKEHLLKINPSSEITAHNVRWESADGDKYFQNCDILVEAFDAAKYKQQLIECYQSKVSSLISGSGMAGSRSSRTLQIKQLDNIFIVGDFVTDTAAGHPPLAPRVTACAAMMAEIVLNITLGQE